MEEKALPKKTSELNILLKEAIEETKKMKQYYGDQRKSVPG